jgi:hypothetical protein
VLAALGYWLILPKLSSGHSAAANSTSPAASAPASASASAPGTPETPAPAVTESPTTAGNLNIYSWLPFTRKRLADAASVTEKFSVDYNTFTYTESPAAYVAKMSGLITGQLATTLQASYSTAGVAALRTSQKQISTGTAVINSLRGRPDQPDIHRHHRAAADQLARDHKWQHAVRDHRHRLGQQLASE